MTARFLPPDSRLADKVRIIPWQSSREILRVASDGYQNGSDNHSDAGGEPRWKRDSFTAAQLQKMEFPPVSWIIPNIVAAE